MGQSLVVERFVGAGGMGAVYLARDELLDRSVAVKLLKAAPDDGVEGVALRTLLEARAAARVVHPHVVAVHAIGDHEGQPYIEMEWVEGGSLRARMLAVPRLPVAQVATWVAQLAAALQQAHDAHVIHCDIKPENVLLRPQLGGAALVKLADFGLARSRTDGTAARTMSQGTQAYLAPELAKLPPDARSDQFSLALMAAELLTGLRPPREHWTKPPRFVAPADLPPAAAMALHRALDGDPRARFGSVTSFADRLLRGLGQAHARGPLVGLDAETAEDLAVTSSEIPVPALPILFQDLSPQDRVMIALAVLPPGHPGALAEMLGAEPAPDVLAELRVAGRIDGTIDECRLAQPREREALLAPLHRRKRRLLCARAAAAIEASGPKRQSVREDAIGLYVAARRLGDAARLAHESAAAARNARQRDHHLARAVAFLSSPVQPLPWLDGLLQRVEWALQCGWLDIARGPLAEAQGLIADLGLELDHPLRLRVVTANAGMQLRTGDLRVAVQQLQVVLRQVRVAQATGGLVLRLQARLIEVTHQLGRAEEALALGRAALEPWEATAADRGDLRLQAGMGRVHAACGAAALRCGQIAKADEHFQRDLAIHQELGDVRHAAGALVSLGSVHFESGELAAAEKAYRQAGAMIAPLGTIELTALIDANLGECWLRTGRPFDAYRSLLRARGVFAEQGNALHEVAVLRLLVQACTAVGDVEGCREAEARLQSLPTRTRH